MSESQVGDVTILLREVRDGVPGATDRLMARVYDELRAIAQNRTRSQGPDGLEPTTLVHESYLRLFRDSKPEWEDRCHFFWAAARAMRDVLVDNARHRGAIKRGGRVKHIEFDDACVLARQASTFLELNEALKKLESKHPSSARVLMLRFFAGLTREQTAEVVGLPEGAVWREWEFARSWLLKELRDDRPDSGIKRS